MNGILAKRALNVAALVLAVVLAVGAMTFASACTHDDGTVSVCHAAQVAVAVAGAVAAVLAAASLPMKNPHAASVALFASAACGLFAAVAPGTAFPLCMMETMRCHIVLSPFAQFLGIALAALAAIAAIRELRARK